jgi:hypothetical protein
MKTIKLSAALALALTAALLAADASHASIVFTKGGNVWRSSPDGRHQARLTSGSAKLIARGAVDPDWGPR